MSLGSANRSIGSREKSQGRDPAFGSRPCGVSDGRLFAREGEADVDVLVFAQEPCGALQRRHAAAERRHQLDELRYGKYQL